MTRVDFLGWVALSVSLIGLALLARGDRRGWLCRVVSGCAWLLFACLKGLPVYIVTSGLYLAIDMYGHVRGRRMKPDENGAPDGTPRFRWRLRFDTRGPIKLWTEH